MVREGRVLVPGVLDESSRTGEDGAEDLRRYSSDVGPGSGGLCDMTESGQSSSPTSTFDRALANGFFAMEHGTCVWKAIAI